MEHDRGRDLTCLERKIISAALSRVESVIRRPFKPEQFSHTGRIQRPSRAIADTASHRTDIVTPYAFHHALNIAAENVDLGEEVMAVKCWLRLNAIRISRNKRIRLPLRGFKKSIAEPRCFTREHHQTFLIHRGVRGCENILA